MEEIEREDSEREDVEGSSAITITDALVASDVLTMRKAQLLVWGRESLPGGTDPDRYLPLCEAAKGECDDADASKALTWGHVLLEEVYEVMSEADPVALYNELTQVAAVAMAWAADLRDNDPAVMAKVIEMSEQVESPDRCECACGEDVAA